MLISHKWIQSYFEKPIPEPEELAAILTMHSFEIEGIEYKTIDSFGIKNISVEEFTNSNSYTDQEDGVYKDAILDVKVLPDRAPYCLSHRYIAEEIGALIRQDIIWPEILEVTEVETKRPLSVKINDDVVEQKVCYRNINRVIENITIEKSPVWLKNKIEALGQRSINTLVDLTNYVTLETGEPTHAFDADKVKGEIIVRFAKEGEELELLDGRIVKLGPSMLVIADEIGPLDIAGVKGGKRTEITNETKNIILEAACFNRSNIRRTSQVVGIRNDASKRFENGVTSERAGLAMAMLTGLVAKLNPQAVIGKAVDVYPHIPEQTIIEVTIADIYTRLGVEVPRDKMIEILTRLNVEVEEGEKTLKLGIPSYRPDLRITEDIAEEVGRVYGYEKILEKVPTGVDNRKVNKNFFYFNVIRKFLAENGFSEVYTYSLVDDGDMAIQNPLTVERSHMRNSISGLMPSKFLLNIKNIELLGLSDIRIFEIGKVFGNKKEQNSLAFGIARPKAVKGIDAKQELENLVGAIVKALGEAVSLSSGSAPIPTILFTELKGDAQTNCIGFVAEILLDELIASLPDPETNADITGSETVGVSSANVSNFAKSISDGTKYKAPSLYPYSVRDIAVFVPGEAGKEGEVLDVIMNALDDDQKKLVVKSTLFDVFTKMAKAEGEQTKTSYAYRLIFQSHERTLEQQEVDECMKIITDTLNAQSGWMVR